MFKIKAIIAGNPVEKLVVPVQIIVEMMDFAVDEAASLWKQVAVAKQEDAASTPVCQKISTEVLDVQDQQPRALKVWAHL